MEKDYSYTYCHNLIIFKKCFATSRIPPTACFGFLMLEGIGKAFRIIVSSCFGEKRPQVGLLLWHERRTPGQA